MVQVYQTPAHSHQPVRSSEAISLTSPVQSLAPHNIAFSPPFWIGFFCNLVHSENIYSPYTPAVRATFNLLLLRNSAFCVSSFWSICCSGVVVVVVVKGALLSVVRPFTFAGPTLHLLSFVCAVCVPDRASLSVVKCALIALVRFDLAPLSSCGVLGSWNFLVHLAL